MTKIEEDKDYLKEALKKQRQKLQTEAENTRKVMESFYQEQGFDDLLGGLAEYYFGSRYKIITSEEGVKTRVPWSREEIFEARTDELSHSDRNIKRDLAGEMMYILESQDEAVQSIELPEEQEKLALTRDFTATLLRKVVTSDENISDPFPARVTEDRYEAELLEAIRRTTSHPTYMLVEGVNERLHVPGYTESMFWVDVESQQEEDDVDPRRMRIEEYRNWQRHKVKENVDSLTPDKWSEVAKKSEQMIVASLKQRVDRGIEEFSQSKDNLSRMLREVDTPETLIEDYRRPENETLREQLSLKEELNECESLSDVLNLARKRWGDEADFSTVLEKTSA